MALINRVIALSAILGLLVLLTERNLNWNSIKGDFPVKAEKCHNLDLRKAYFTLSSRKPVLNIWVSKAKTRLITHFWTKTRMQPIPSYNQTCTHFPSTE